MVHYFISLLINIFHSIQAQLANLSHLFKVFNLKIFQLFLYIYNVSINLSVYYCILPLRIIIMICVFSLILLLLNQLVYIKE